MAMEWPINRLTFGFSSQRASTSPCNSVLRCLIMEFLEPPAHGFDRFRQGRGSAGESDHGDTAKPFRLQFFRALNVQRSFAGRPTGLDQLTRVVALAATNNHDDLYPLDQFLE